MAGAFVGTSVKRREDAKFLTGRGNYVDDINRPGQLHAFILRSPHAHASLGAVKTDKAAKRPGVLAVFSGADMEADGIGGLPCGWLIHNKDGSPMVEPPHPPLAQGKVRHVGDPVVAVIAETYAQARHAAEHVEIDYKPPPAGADPAKAIDRGPSQLHDVA